MLPNFLVIGAGRCGTTSLCAALAQHPEVFVSSPKETGFFSEFYERGWAWYESLFSEGTDKTAIGEGTVNYSKRTAFPEVTARIATGLPAVRLIYIVRHPLKRVESDWRYSRTVGLERLPLAEALASRPVYVDASDYLGQIDAYRDYYPDRNILVLFLADMKRDHATTLRRCFEFLDVDPDFRVKDRRPRNVGTSTFHDRALAGSLRKSAGGRRLRNLLPHTFRQGLRVLLKRTSPAEPPLWTPALFEKTGKRLSANTKTFLTRYGKPPDFWRFDPAQHRMI